MRQGEFKRHGAAHRMTNQMRAVEPNAIHKAAQDLGKFRESTGSDLL